MNAALREMLVEIHGDEEGERIFAVAQARRDRLAKLPALQAELETTRTTCAAEIAASTQRLADRQQDINVAYANWLAACGALEAAKIDLQQRKATLRDRVRAIMVEMTSAPAPAPLVSNWQPPSWAKPESDVKGGGA